MKQNLKAAILFTAVTTILFGVLYPLAVTGLAQIFFPAQANGELIVRNGQVIGSHLIAQGFFSDRYFHPRPSGAGNGYDPVASGGSATNLGPTNKALLDRVNSDVQKLNAENPGAPVPIDLVTTSASGVDPDITPASAEFQIPRVAKARGITQDQMRSLVVKHTKRRQWGFLGEPRVNVLELNLELDALYPPR